MNTAALLPALCLSLLLSLAACDREPDVETYLAQRDTPPAAALRPAVTAAAAPNTAASAPNSAGPSTGRTQLTWSPPPGWHQSQGSGVRAATLKPQGGTETIGIAITYLREDKSSLESNINRWRGQVGLAPITDDEIAADRHAFKHNGLIGHYIDLQGRDDRMIVVWFPFPDGTWYFKMTGGVDDVANNETTMRTFARSIRRIGRIGPGTPPTDTTPATGTDPAPGSYPAPGITPATDTVQRVQLTRDEIQDPESSQAFSHSGLQGRTAKTWEPSPNAAMVIVGFSTPNQARVSISSFPGNVGGPKANVGRWIRQLGLTAESATVNNQYFIVDEVPINTYEILPNELTDDANASIIATVRDAERSYFVKITGNAKGVAAELENFLYFIANLQLPLVKPLPPKGWQ